LPAHAKEVEELNEQLLKERAAKKKVEEEKAALEAELEALSQALFEEVGFNLFTSVSHHS
jgi:ribosomal protein L9